MPCDSKCATVGLLQPRHMSTDSDDVLADNSKKLSKSFLAYYMSKLQQVAMRFCYMHRRSQSFCLGMSCCSLSIVMPLSATFRRASWIPLYTLLSTKLFSTICVTENTVQRDPILSLIKIIRVLRGSRTPGSSLWLRHWLIEVATHYAPPLSSGGYHTLTWRSHRHSVAAYL